MGLSRRSLLTLRVPERDGQPREPRPYPLPDGAPALMTALQPLRALLREIAGEGALDLSVGAHTELDALPYGDQSAQAIVSVLGVALAPRPKRAGRELVRVLAPGGQYRGVGQPGFRASTICQLSCIESVPGPGE